MSDQLIPIVCIVGAGRSGTNFLARSLGHDNQFRNLGENRYIWNHGQKFLRTDRRNTKEATTETREFIRSHFQGIHGSCGKMLIDKTPGNALRLEFVKAILPEAKIINIIRDGRACVYSRKMLWEGDVNRKPVDFPIKRYLHQFFLMQRNGNIPIRRLPTFLADNMAHYVSGLLLRRPILAGERMPGLREIAKVDGMMRARAFQWRETVLAAVSCGRRLGSEHYLEIRLEDMLVKPDEIFRQIYEFLGLDYSHAPANHISERSDLGRQSVWFSGLDDSTRQDLEDMLAPDLRFLGYVE